VSFAQPGTPIPMLHPTVADKAFSGDCYGSCFHKKDAE
jgi:hypothetical protein